MKVIRVPLRVSLFGGGTDLPSYYEKHGSTIISFAITRYMYLIWNPRPTGGCRLSYSEVEELETLKDAKHTLVRAAAERYGFEEPCTLTIISDVPKGTGLGSSSALSVALCRLTFEWKTDEPIYWESLAATAYDLEHSISPAGRQDHLPAVYGGFRCYKIFTDGAVIAGEHLVPASYIIDEYGLLLYTGQSRESSEILINWQEEENLRPIHGIAQCAERTMYSWMPETLAALLHATWVAKSTIGSVSDSGFDDQYQRAIKVGALGGKLCGAGGGGCWFFLVPPERRQAVIDELGLVEIPFQVAEKRVTEWEI